MRPVQTTSLLRLDGKAGKISLPDDRANHGLVVLEVEITMAAGMAIDPTELALDANIGECLLNGAFQEARNLADGKFLQVRRSAGLATDI